MLKIGHRGAKGYIAENTVESFKKAIELGVHGVELDVHLSKDNQIMVIHDETINRTTTGNGKVNDLLCTQLEQYGIPKLTDVINCIGNEYLINIEIKDSKATLQVVTLIQNLVNNHNWLYEKLIVSSFDWEILEKISTLDTNISLGVLTEKDIDSAIKFGKKINAKTINPYYKILTDAYVTQIHSEGFKVHTWTVNNVDDITFVKKIGVDAIISDFPDRL